MAKREGTVALKGEERGDLSLKGEERGDLALKGEERGDSRTLAPSIVVSQTELSL